MLIGFWGRYLVLTQEIIYDYKAVKKQFYLQESLLRSLIKKLLLPHTRYFIEQQKNQSWVITIESANETTSYVLTVGPIPSHQKHHGILVTLTCVHKHAECSCFLLCDEEGAMRISYFTI